ncbi:hypothetical protein Dip510_001117 [Elusimicrobium posterum]|uniref:hypothetical protein n=1 Tax=Elusimicrobium posterum TaxID=3116653 RepID=UPI003C77304F
MKRIFTAVALILTLALGAQAQELRRDTYLIDIPTAETLEHYTTSFNTRFFSEGSVMETIDFGIYPRLNIGFSISAQNVIGTDTPIRVLVPQFQVKYKLYDGSLYLPAIAIGYDGREYMYDRATKDYAHERKGAYLVASREIIIPNLQFHPGVNVSDFDSSDIYFFTGVNFNIEDVVNAMFEWDNVHNISDSRLNAGVRIYINDSFDLDLGLRDMTHKSTFERIVQLTYRTSF